MGGRKIGSKPKLTTVIPGFNEPPHSNFKDVKSSPHANPNDVAICVPIQIQSPRKRSPKPELVVGSPKKSPSPIMESANIPSSPETSSSDSNNLPKSESVKYTYKQTRALCDILQDKLIIPFWICLSKEQQEDEKENPTDIAYYRLGFCKYNNTPLINVMRYFPDRSKYFKSKSYATINLSTMRPTNNSQHKPNFTDEEIKTIREILG